MLGIILFILKVLGIIVLCALGLTFLILLLVLFAPIRYSSEGSKYVDNLQVKALVTYLNPIVRVKISYPDEAIVKVPKYIYQYDRPYFIFIKAHK